MFVTVPGDRRMSGLEYGSLAKPPFNVDINTTNKNILAISKEFYKLIITTLSGGDPSDDLTIKAC